MIQAKFQILKTPMFKHQMNNVKFHLLHNKTGDWSDCGTGKTLTALGVFTMRNKAGEADRMLVVCPLSVMHTWELEVAKHTPYTVQLLTGTVQEKLKQLTLPAHIYALTYDSIPGRGGTEGKLLEALLEKRFHMLVIDEVTYVKSYKAKRTQVLTYLADTIPFSLALSGTFVPNRAEQIITIYRVMDGGKTFGRNYHAALRQWFHNVGFGFPKWDLKADKEEEFKSRLFTRAVRVRKEECLDLPDKVYLERYGSLGPTQKKLYAKVADELYKEITLDSSVAKVNGKGNKKINLSNVLPRMAKMRQITGGFVYNQDDKIELLENPKIDLLRETIECLPEEEKFIIYYIHKQDRVFIEELLKDMDINSGVIDGSTDSNSRGVLIDSLCVGSLRCLMIQQQSGGFGLNLQVCHNMIYYNHSNSVIEWQQSQDRIHRMGQRDDCNYYILMIKDTIDEYLYAMMKNKMDLVNALQNEAEVLRLKANLELLLGKRVTASA